MKTFCILFFFFQAEDGIRDKLVTGVQTCALPISAAFCSPGMGRISRSWVSGYTPMQNAAVPPAQSPNRYLPRSNPRMSEYSRRRRLPSVSVSAAFRDCRRRRALPPRLDAEVLGDGRGGVVAARAADGSPRVRGCATQVDVGECGSVGRKLVERPEDAQLVLRHLPVVPVAVLHGGHHTFDVDRARDVPPNDRRFLESNGQVRPPAREDR